MCQLRWQASERSRRASAVFVTTFTDVLGFLFFLGLAAVLVESLE